MADLAPYVAAFGPVAGVFLYLWANRAQKPSERSDDPLRAVNANLTAIRDDLGDVFDRLGDIHTALEVLKDRRDR
jgi:hypothetical protein